MAQRSEVKISIKVEGIENNLDKLAKLELELAAVNKQMAEAKKINDAAAYTEFRKKQDELKDSIKGVSAEIREQKKLLERVDFAEGSYRDLNAQLVELRASYKDLSEAERESEIGKATLENIQELDTRLKGIDATMGQFQRNVGNYEGAIAKALEDAGVKGALEARLKNLRQEQDKLKEEAKELAKAYMNASAQGSADLQGLERQILENQQAQSRLNAEIRQSGGGTGNFTSGLTSLGGNIPFLSEIMEAFSGGSELAGAFGGRIASLGPIIGVAFGAFAAGGVVYKALDVLAGLGNEFGKLEGAIKGFSGASGSELDNLAVEVKSISDTFGATTQEVNLAANSLSKSFGIDFAKAVELVKKGFLSGADANGELIENLKEYSTVIKNAGYDSEEFVAILAQQAAGGTYSDKLIDSVKELGLSFGELTKASQDALKPLGEEFANNLIKNINNGSVSAAEALKLIDEQGQKVGLSVSQIGTITADVFRGAGEDAGGYLRVIEQVNIATAKGIDGFIDQSNYATRAANATLQANKELASAQAGLANLAGDLGISWDVIGTKLLTFIANIAKNFLIYSNEIKLAALGLALIFGGPLTVAVVSLGVLFTGWQSGMAKTKEEARLLTEQLSDQQKKVEGLEKNVSPLVKVYEDLQKQSKANEASGKDNTKVQAALLEVMRQLGEAVPTAVTEFDEYGRALKINTKEVNDYLKREQGTLSAIRDAKNSKDIEMLTKYMEKVKTITSEINKLQADIDRKSSGQDAGFNLDKSLGIEENLDIQRNKIIELSRELNIAGNEAANLEKQLLAAGQKFDVTALKQGYTGALRQRFADIATEYKAEEDASKKKQELQKKEIEARTAEQKAADDAAAKRRKEEADRRAKEAEAERKRIESEYQSLLKAAGVSEAAYREAINNSKKETLKVSLEQITDRFEREKKLNEFNFTEQTNEIRKALQAQSTALIEQYEKEIEFIKANPSYQSRFGSKAEIQERIKGVTAETNAQITAQTNEMAAMYQKQATDLQKAKDEALRSAQKAITDDGLQNDLTQATNADANAQAQADGINAIFDLRDKRAEESYDNDLIKLQESLAKKEITEEAYSNSIKALDSTLLASKLENAKLENAELQAVYDKQITAKMQLIEIQKQINKAAIDEELRRKTTEAQTKTETGARGAANPADAKKLELLEIQNAEREHQLKIQQLDRSTETERAKLVNERINKEVDGNNAIVEIIKEANNKALEDTKTKAKEKDDFTKELIQASIATSQQIATEAFSVLQQSSDNQRQEQMDLIDAKFEYEKERAMGNVELIEQAEKRKSVAQKQAADEAGARNKSLALSQAIVNAALSITSILAQYPKFDGGFAMAAALAAATIANAAAIAKIATTKYAGGGILPTAISDGMIQGRSHANGGVKVMNFDGSISEVEGGEYIQTDEYGRKVVVNKYSSRLFGSRLAQLSKVNFLGKANELSKINSYGGLGKKFALGGIMPSPSPQLSAPVVRTSGTDNFGVFQYNIETLRDTNTMLASYIEATNNRIDRILVTTDPAELYGKGLEGYEERKINIID